MTGRVEKSEAEIKQLRKELVMKMGAIFMHYTGNPCLDAETSGWWFAVCTEGANRFAKRLVELSVWERHPIADKFLYRPIAEE